ncbi:hypothetical protein [Modicisalibacter tunisiensis]|uniref:Uncharacterized protein n=1 Tax=Modicisalibacter tunisiensis TaxID=390637 RepID=A0ABS7WYD1_9GAMM|nr:hypothetical protein [Modicisalibacter tunisiensis]MBZ9566752.1 hypothetical protein [Modicisalibacter tunisiensis]
MNHELGSMIIDNPGRRSLSYRLRDTALVMATLGLWGLFALQIWSTLASSEFLIEQAYALAVLKLTALDFVGVFFLLHSWVIYERLLFRWRQRIATRHA